MLAFATSPERDVHNVKFYLVTSLSIIVGILVFAGQVNAGLALLAGLGIALTLQHNYGDFCRKYSALLLKFAIVGLGFSLNVHQLIASTQDIFLITFITIAVALATGLILYRLLKVQEETGLLVTSGTAICGGSAIAAVSQVIKSRPDQTAMAVTVVFLLNIVALYVFPPLGEWLELSQRQFGIWAALAIHDTSSVLGAAAQFGDESLTIATTTKLFRALWIIPLTLIVAAFSKNKESKPQIPIFIVLFVLAAIANSYLPFGQVAETVSLISKRLLIFALFLLGLGVTPSILKNVDTRPLILGTLLWFIIAATSLLLVLYG